MKKKLSCFWAAALSVFLCAASFASDISRVRHVSDGDTLVLENGEKVRLIGVDTPEMDNLKRNQQNARKNKIDEKLVLLFASKAKDYMRQAIEGKTVRLEYDWQRLDKYGRTLAYVYRQEDNLFLNADIIQQGYGFSYNYFPYRYSDLFKGYEAAARKNNKGLWAPTEK